MARRRPSRDTRARGGFLAEARRRGLLAAVRRRGLTHGLLGDSTAWLLAGMAAWALHGLRRAFSFAGDPAKYLQVKTGDRLTVRNRR